MILRPPVTCNFCHIVFGIQSCAICWGPIVKIWAGFYTLTSCFGPALDCTIVETRISYICINASMRFHSLYDQFIAINHFRLVPHSIQFLIEMQFTFKQQQTISMA